MIVSIKKWQEEHRKNITKTTKKSAPSGTKNGISKIKTMPIKEEETTIIKTETS